MVNSSASRDANGRVIAPLSANTVNGNANANPSPRPHIRCAHSIQYMNLNSSRAIEMLTRLNSGDCLYRANSAVHSASVPGGFSPVNFQSVIDRPDRVSRVIPPKTTILKTHAEDPPSHQVTALHCDAVRPSTSDRAVAGISVDTAAVDAADDVDAMDADDDEYRPACLVPCRAAAATVVLTPALTFAKFARRAT